MKNQIAIYYMLFILIIVIISRFFITDIPISNYNKHMSEIGNAIVSDSMINPISYDLDEISDILDSGLSRVESIVDSIVGNKLDVRDKVESSLAKSILQFGIYMPENSITEIDMTEEKFLLIKSLIMEKSMLLDNGAIAYFRYAFKEEIDKNNPELLYSTNCIEIENFNKTDPDKITGLILEKELYLEDGAIFYFAYKF